MVTGGGSTTLRCEKCVVALKFDDSDACAERSHAHLVYKGDGHRVASSKLQYDDTYPDVPILKASERAGCDFCGLLRSAIQSRGFRSVLEDNQLNRYPTLRISFSVQYNFKHCALDGKDDEKVGVWILAVVLRLFPEDQELETRSYIYFPVSADDGSCASWLRLPPTIESWALAGRPLSFMKRALQQCVDNCAHSGSRLLSDFLPTRLIDVRGDPLRIVETASLVRQHAEVNKYLTLSYVWGTPEEAQSQVKLTKSSEPTLLSAFSLTHLSPVQRDAVRLAQALAIPYVWIDALCILQNDAADWQCESSQMHRIYSGAHLTVCALTSNSCQEGFLRRDSRTLDIPFQSIVKPSVTGSYKIRHPGIWSSDEVIVDGWTDRDFRSSAWSRRGWTYQEAIMSTRMLLFSTSGMHFVCPRGAMSEHCGVKTETDGNLALGNLEALGKGEALYEWWYDRVVGEYSSRMLTETRDALPALSGLARRLAAAMGDDEYVAGIWEKRAFAGLFYYSALSPESLASLVASLSSPSRPTPSWSWLGRGKVFMLPLPGKRPWKVECGAMSFSVTAKGLDKFGEISSARLSVTAPVYPWKRGYHLEDDSSPFQKTGMLRLRDVNETRVAFYLDWQPLDGEDFTEQLSFVLMGTRVDDSSTPSGRNKTSSTNAFIFGLIIAHVPGGNTYVRVGLFDTPSWGGGRVANGPTGRGDWNTQSLDII